MAGRSFGDIWGGHHWEDLGWVNQLCFPSAGAVFFFFGYIMGDLMARACPELAGLCAKRKGDQGWIIGSGTKGLSKRGEGVLGGSRRRPAHQMTHEET